MISTPVRRAAALAGTATGLALAISSNYYGVLALIRIAAGEVGASLRTRRIRPTAWLALIFGALPLLLYRPLIQLHLAEFGPHARVAPTSPCCPTHTCSSWRLIFPIDFAAIHAFEPDDSGEQNLWAGRNGIFPFRIVPYRSHELPPAFVLLARPNGWLPTRLIRDGYRLTIPHPSPWPDRGGVFTPLSHADTRLLVGRPGRSVTPSALH